MSKTLGKKLSNDIDEIKEFIYAYGSKTKGDYKIVLDNMTESLDDEEYRNARAK